MFRWAAHLTTWLGWSLAAASLFLPVSNAVQRAGVPRGTPIAGWEALSTIGSLAFAPFVWMLAPELLWLAVAAVGTLVLLAMGPALALAKDEAGIMQVPLVFVPAALLLVPPHVQQSLCWGVAVWGLAFALFAAGGVGRCVLAAICPAADSEVVRAPA